MTEEGQVSGKLRPAVVIRALSLICLCLFLSTVFPPS